jgi:hypothetical protein
MHCCVAGQSAHAAPLCWQLPSVPHVFVAVDEHAVAQQTLDAGAESSGSQ